MNRHSEFHDLLGREISPDRSFYLFGDHNKTINRYITCMSHTICDMYRQ